MDLLVCQNERQWVETVHNFVLASIQDSDQPRVYIPAGDTPRPLYRYWEKLGQGGDVCASELQVLRGVSLVQIDEVLNGQRPFAQFLCESLPSYTSQIEFFESGGTQADVALLGLGLNGHVGFHEPGIPNDFYSGCVDLCADTIEKLKLAAGTRGATYGLGAFMKCKSVILIVRGEGKRDILQRVLNGPSTVSRQSDLPAATLLAHPNLKIVTDFKP